MPRPRNSIGDLGAIQFTTLAGGGVRGRARIRDDGGILHRVNRTAATRQEVIVLLRNAATEISTGVEELLRSDSTVADACAVWLVEVRTSARLAVSTLESYEDTVRNIVVPACGGITLADLSVGRCDRIIQRLLATRSISAARKARSVLSLVCGTAVRHDVLRANPIRDVQRLPTSAKKESYLNAEQIAIVRVLMHNWRTEKGNNGPRPDSLKLEDGMDIMIGTSARLGEILALRRTDVSITTDPPTVLIASTLVTTRQDGMTRKPAPKRTRQIRRIALPSFSAAAVRRRLALTKHGNEAYLFTTRTGQPYSVSNFERLLRSFIADNQGPLRDAGIRVDEFSSHIFRRTAATLVERAAGITIASRLLGHASETITRANYAVTAEQVDPVTAIILDNALERSHP
ncbi:site-specific integrase [soil metagenome]